VRLLWRDTLDLRKRLHQEDVVQHMLERARLSSRALH
jgi:hypothetical protein